MSGLIPSVYCDSEAFVFSRLMVLLHTICIPMKIAAPARLLLTHITRTMSPAGAKKNPILKQVRIHSHICVNQTAFSSSLAMALRDHRKPSSGFDCGGRSHNYSLTCNRSATYETKKIDPTTSARNNLSCGLNSTLGPFHGGLRRHTVWRLAAGT
jgi:hypothetical protein